jgi:hypothetical protein
VKNPAADSSSNFFLTTENLNVHQGETNNYIQIHSRVQTNQSAANGTQILEKEY